ncbi:hypothetical protein ACH0C8_15650, partial [Acetobacter lovaniensis]|uniref:hypothetical protein n=1 Tax=Acetobacter lovaniensis TaxID=104100 RepID=UPI0037702EC6
VYYIRPMPIKAAILNCRPVQPDSSLSGNVRGLNAKKAECELPPKNDIRLLQKPEQPHGPPLQITTKEIAPV